MNRCLSQCQLRHIFQYLAVIGLIFFQGVPPASAATADIEIRLDLIARPPLWIVSKTPDTDDIKVTSGSIPDSTLDSLHNLVGNAKGLPTNVVGQLISKWVTSNNMDLRGVVTNPFPGAATQHEVGSRKPHVIKFSLGSKKIERVQIFLVSPRAKDERGKSLLEENFKVSDPGIERTGSLSSFNTRYDLLLTPAPFSAAWDHIRASYVYVAADLEEFQKRAKRDGNLRLKFEQEYEAVAAIYAAFFYNKGVKPGSAIPPDLPDILKQAIASISGGFADSSRGYSISSNGTLNIVIADVGFPGVVSITVAESHQEQRWLEEELKKRYLGENERYTLINKGDHIIVAEGIQADLTLLRSDRSFVKTTFEPKGGQEMNFVVTPAERVSKHVKLSIGAAYSPEKSVSGILSADFSDVTEEKDVLQLTLEAGDLSISGDGEIKLPLSDAPDAVCFISRMGSEELDETYLGNLTRGPFETYETHADLGLGYVWESATHYQRFEAERALRRNRERCAMRWAFEGGLRYSDYSLDGLPEAITGLDDGDALGPYLKLGYRAEYDARNRAGTERWQSILIDTVLDLDSGMSAFAGNDDYLRACLKCDLRANFLSHGDEMGYLSLGLTGAWASDDTPDWITFRGGAQGFVRGLHEDEFIGRSYVGGRMEAGLNLQWLMSHGKKAVSSGTASTESSGLPKGTYIGSFADLGILSHRIEDGRNSEGSKHLQGYGVHLQVTSGSIWNRTTSLSVGYAWSPQSELHESGTVFTSVALDF